MPIDINMWIYCAKYKTTELHDLYFVSALDIEVTQILKSFPMEDTDLLSILQRQFVADDLAHLSYWLRSPIIFRFQHQKSWILKRWMVPYFSVHSWAQHESIISMWIFRINHWINGRNDMSNTASKLNGLFTAYSSQTLVLCFKYDCLFCFSLIIQVVRFYCWHAH